MQLFLNSAWRELSEKSEVLNPFDGSVIDTVPVASPSEINAAIDGLAKGLKRCAKYHLTSASKF